MPDCVRTVGVSVVDLPPPPAGQASSFSPGHKRALTLVDFEVSGHGQVLAGECFSDAVPAGVLARASGS